MTENKITQAFIFTGGSGKFLASFTDTNPKPMFSIEGKSHIEHLIFQIKLFGLWSIRLGWKS